MTRTLDYLRRITTETGEEIDSALASIDEQQRRFDRFAEAEPEQARAALLRLAERRLLASNTLMRRDERSERLAWDAANELVASCLSRDEEVDVVRLNQVLTGATTEARFRDAPVYSSGLAYLEPEHVAREVSLLHDRRAKLSHPVLRAAVTYIGIVTIHPFDNGNGRTSRLAADAVLIGAGYLPIYFRSPIEAHVAQMTGGPARDPVGAIRVVLSAIEESYSSSMTTLS